MAKVELNNLTNCYDKLDEFGNFYKYYNLFSIRVEFN